MLFFQSKKNVEIKRTVQIILLWNNAWAKCHLHSDFSPAKIFCNGLWHSNCEFFLFVTKKAFRNEEKWNLNKINRWGNRKRANRLSIIIQFSNNAQFDLDERNILYAQQKTIKKTTVWLRNGDHVYDDVPCFMLFNKRRIARLYGFCSKALPLHNW